MISLRKTTQSTLANLHFTSLALRKMSYDANPKQNRTAIYAGTFDPPTSGHLDIMRRGLTLCDKLYIGIATNSSKK